MEVLKIVKSKDRPTHIGTIAAVSRTLRMNWVLQLSPVVGNVRTQWLIHIIVIITMATSQIFQVADMIMFVEIMIIRNTISIIYRIMNFLIAVIGNIKGSVLILHVLVNVSWKPVLTR